LNSVTLLVVQFMFLCFTGHITFTLPALLHCSIHVFFMFYWTYYIHFTSTVTNVICPVKHRKTWIEQCNIAGKVNVICPVKHKNMNWTVQHCYTVQFMFLCFTGHITFTLPALLHCSIHVFMFYWTYYIHF
jgi:hypothetical protein